MSSWSLSLVNQTRDILYNMPPGVFLLAEKLGRKGVCLRNFDGRNGYIRLTDCLNDRYPIRSHETDEVLADFSTIDELVAGDWALD